VVSLDNSPEYEALSYVWGDSSDRREIEVKGKALPVTLSLAMAIQHLRLEPKGNVTASLSSKMNRDFMYFRDLPGIGTAFESYPAPSRVLWVDALCINQADMVEKTAQVPKIGVIYQKAVSVVCWMGPKSNTSDRALQIQKRLFKMKMKPGPAEFDAPFDPMNWGAFYNDHDDSTTTWLSMAIRDLSVDDLDALVRFFERPWCTRVWIIQEITLAQKAIALIGDETIPFQFLVTFYTENIWIPITKIPVPNANYYGSVSLKLSWALTDRRKALFDALTRPQMMNSFSTYLSSRHT
jgi:hypothetical protein